MCVHKQRYQHTYRCLPSHTLSTSGGCVCIFLTRLIKGDCVYNCVMTYPFIFLLAVTVTTREGVWRWGRHRPHSHDLSHLSHLQRVLFYTTLYYTAIVYLTSSCVLLRFNNFLQRLRLQHAASFQYKGSLTGNPHVPNNTLLTPFQKCSVCDTSSWDLWPSRMSSQSAETEILPTDLRTLA